MPDESSRTQIQIINCKNNTIYLHCALQNEEHKRKTIVTKTHCPSVFWTQSVKFAELIFNHTELNHSNPTWFIEMILNYMFYFLLHLLNKEGTAVAQWLRCRATNRKVAGSIPADVSGFLIDIKSFRSHYGPGVDSASNRNEYQEYFLGVKAAGA